MKYNETILARGGLADYHPAHSVGPDLCGSWEEQPELVEFGGNDRVRRTARCRLVMHQDHGNGS
jgi:hypothetical protein